MKFLKMSLLTINIIFMVTFIVFFPLNITLADERKVSLNDPLGLSGNEKALQIIIGRVINASLGIVGSLALLMFVYSGLLLITSAGNQEKVEQGKKILIWSTAGLALVFFSYVLVLFIIKGLTGQNKNTSFQTSYINEV